MILAGSGHRPESFPSYPGAIVKLGAIIRQKLLLLQPSYVITGLARGFDMELAYQCFDLGIPYIAYGTVNQADKWGAKGRYGKIAYLELLGHAEDQNLSAEGTYLERNKKMVDACTELLILYNKQLPISDTGATFRYAVKQFKPITNIWDTFKEELWR